MELEKKVYKQILKLIKKHKDILNIDFNSLEFNSKCDLYVERHSMTNLHKTIFWYKF